MGCMLWQISSTWHNKKITYNHLWKYCSAELQNLNVYRSLHSDRTETVKPDVRLWADWFFCNVWFLSSHGYRKCAFSFMDSLFMRKTKKETLVINGWHWAWMSKNHWGGVDSRKLPTVLWWSLQMTDDCYSALPQCWKGVNVQFCPFFFFLRRVHISNIMWYCPFEYKFN